MSVLSEHLQRTGAPAGTGLPALPRVNLLPPEIAEAARFRRIQAGLGGALLATVGVVAALYLSAAGSVSDAQTELDAQTAIGTALQAETAKYAEVEAVYARAAAAEQMLTTAMGQEVRYSQYLNDLSLTVPENVWLKDVSFDQAVASGATGADPSAIGTVTFTGMAFKHDDVAVWLDSLAKQKGYVNPYFSSSAKELIGSRPVVKFTSTVSLTADALSRRYTTPQGG